MEEHLARTMFSNSVQDQMMTNGDLMEAEFCKIIRNALHIADNQPGSPASGRCKHRLDVINWLKEDIDFVLHLIKNQRIIQCTIGRSKK